MPRPKSDTVQIVLRVPRRWLAQAAELAQKRSCAGLKLSRSDGFRLAIAAGLYRDEPAPGRIPSLENRLGSGQSAKEFNLINVKRSRG